ncbi:DNA excision repair protein ERCC-1 isoform X2 [Heterodontus francisci]|uniref:DNA excision repair protein ERCC-1 isoform X2 n=1 Tax=Heterodontus francisci TaxID=7792 RepID=UPI00355C3F0E
MANAKGTPKKFEIPALEDVYRPDPVLVRPLFRSRAAAETRIEDEGESGPQVAPRGDPPPGEQQGPPAASEGPRAAGGDPGPGEQARGAVEVTGKTVAKQNTIVVSPRQRGNPILKFVRNVPWEFGEVVPDYVLGQTTCALYLSLRYHCLNQEYIHSRLKALGQAFALRILLVQVDVKDPHHELKELAKICLLADCTLILAWSCEEAGRYLETYKVFENKPSDILKERVESDFLSKVTDCLTTVKSVNKTDSLTLLSTFKSLRNVILASQEELSLCPGLGPQKARRLFEAFHEPFLRSPRSDPGKVHT